MKNRKPVWSGSSVDDFIAAEMVKPDFRVAFAKARARRIKQVLAEAVQSARKRSRLSQTVLAKRVKTTQAVISRIENPDLQYLPSVEVLSRIAIALGAQLEISFVPLLKKAA